MQIEIIHRKTGTIILETNNAFFLFTFLIFSTLLVKLKFLISILVAGTKVLARTNQTRWSFFEETVKGFEPLKSFIKKLHLRQPSVSNCPVLCGFIMLSEAIQNSIPSQKTSCLKFIVITILKICVRQCYR